MAKDFLIMKQFIFWTKDRNMTNFIMRKVYNTLSKNWILPYEYISLIWQYTHQLIRNQSFGGKDLYKFVTNDTHRLLSCWWKWVDYQIKLPFIRRNMNWWKLLHFDVGRETSNSCLRVIYHDKYMKEIMFWNRNNDMNKMFLDGWPDFWEFCNFA